LGALEVVDDADAPVLLPAANERALMAALLTRPNQAVPVDDLVAAIWGDDPPRTATKTLQTYVSRLRRALMPSDRIATTPPGYMLRLGDDELDVAHFERAVSAGRAALSRSEPQEAAHLLQQSLDLWRGRAYEEFRDRPFAFTEAIRLEEMRVAAQEELYDARLQLGAHGEVVAPLEALVADNPLRERLWALLMTALYRCGRQADALHAFQRARRTLAEDLGIDPGPELRRLEQAVLTHDPQLGPGAVPASGPPERAGQERVTPAPVAMPATQYAKTVDQVHIAFQIVGAGDRDLVFVPPIVSHVEAFWDDPEIAAANARLSSFSRLILFDKRGTGLSDPVPSDAYPTLEQRADDIRAVMDAAGSERAVLYGIADGAALAVFFAASHPDRVEALILFGAAATWTPDFDHPWGFPADQQQVFLNEIEARWGSGAMVPIIAPGRVGDAAFTARAARLERMAASPAMAVAAQRMNFDVDLRPVLPAVRVPTLVLHDHTFWITFFAKYLAEHITDAQLVEVPFDDLGHLQSATLDVIEEFVTGERPLPPMDRVLSTVLFVDIVGSTRRAAEQGDAAWRADLDRYERLVEHQLERFRGVLVKPTGDGTLATFDGPARGIACAVAIADGVRGLGLAARAGLHTGEIETRGDDIAGIAVHIASRICSLADAAEVLVSRTVVDLVAGSGIGFDDRGERQLEGVPGEWRVFAVQR
jgi:DNA-binding SARP family transcriptional activator/class 3 adenylate cyclase/pimeloyl-ACP methyl ester carboxylesterase